LGAAAIAQHAECAGENVPLRESQDRDAALVTERSSRSLFSNIRWQLWAIPGVDADSGSIFDDLLIAVQKPT
jgi:hypothetical protein